MTANPLRHLELLEFSGLRNLAPTQLEPHPQINFITGQNGSGKTSLLEAIYLLGHGKSFRSTDWNDVIQHGSERTTLFTRVGYDVLGIEKTRSEGIRIKKNGESQRSLADLSKCLPMLLLEPRHMELLTHGPSYRRQFMDWGLFHVEPSFAALWRSWQQSLKQRNAALKRGASLRELESWDRELCVFSDKIDELRKRYVEEFSSFCCREIASLAPFLGFTLQYQRGWPASESLIDILRKNYTKDSQLGYTQQGPQRADLVFLVQNRPAIHALSRGQQKILICSLFIAQGKYLLENTGKTSIYLIDDMAAELDKTHREHLLQALWSLQGQVFYTTVEMQAEFESWMAKGQVFHVKQGVINAEIAV